MEENNKDNQDAHWRHPSKHLEPTTEGICRFCKKHVKALEAHMHDMHHKELKREAEHH